MVHGTVVLVTGLTLRFSSKSTVVKLWRPSSFYDNDCNTSTSADAVAVAL